MILKSLEKNKMHISQFKKPVPLKWLQAASQFVNVLSRSKAKRRVLHLRSECSSQCSCAEKSTEMLFLSLHAEICTDNLYFVLV